MIPIYLLHGAALLPSLYGPAYDKAFLRAAEQGDVPRLRVLLSQGANINATQQNDWTALMLAARDGRDHAAAFLIARHADVYHRTNIYYNYDALTLAAENGDIPLTKLLIAHRANVNAADNSGNTVLMQMLGNSNIPPAKRMKLTKILLRAGANLNAKNAMGNTILSQEKIGLHSFYEGPRVRPLVYFLERLGAK